MHLPTAASEDLRKWTRDLDSMRAHGTKALSSGDVRDAVMTGKSRVAHETHALQNAATALSVGNWVPLDNAMGWITKHRPDETPQAYECRSWQQVIHGSKCYTLDLRKVEDRRERCYSPPVQRK